MTPDPRKDAKAVAMVSAPKSMRTARLNLRQATDADIDDVFAYASDPEVTPYLVWKRLTEPAQVATFLARCRERWESGVEHTWFITESSRDVVIGAVAARIRDSEAEIGFVLDRRYWNRGYTTEAATAVVSWLFSLPQLERVCATCDAENAPSARVLAKLGMVNVGRVPGGMVRPNLSSVPRDSLMYERAS
jgi:ribosomal-protein-alanine N-acetyltransferase